jgi:curved DNA-binding protein CbpA
MASNNYYAILKVSQTASGEEIKESYLKLTKQIIADKTLTKDLGKSALEELEEAWETLSTDREAYDLRLEEHIDSFIPPKKSPFDFARFKKISKKPWQDLCTDSDPFLALKSVFDATIYLPDKDIQQNLLIASLLAPSAMSSILPLVFINGTEGTGKSQIGKLAAKLWNIPPLSANSSYASLRNELEDRRKGMFDGVWYYQNIFLVWSDITELDLRFQSSPSPKTGCNCTVCA